MLFLALLLCWTAVGQAQTLGPQRLGNAEISRLVEGKTVQKHCDSGYDLFEYIAAGHSHTRVDDAIGNKAMHSIVEIKNNMLCAGDGCVALVRRPDGRIEAFWSSGKRAYQIVGIQAGDARQSVAAWKDGQGYRDNWNRQANDVVQGWVRQMKEDADCAAMGGRSAGSGRCWVRR